MSSARLQFSKDVQTIRASSPSGNERAIEIQHDSSVSSGSFGVVYKIHNNETVAIKKVLQDKRYKNRELQIMRKLDQRNVVKLNYFYYQNGEKKDEVYLNLVLEYVPDTIYRVARHYTKQRKIVPMLYIKIYIYQMFRAIAYIHSLAIRHRDIKPQNLLINTQTSVLKLCDFCSAKILAPGEPNVAYIYSRYYRAPELIFGATDYTTKIDVWSAGAVLAELLLGQPFFPGESGVDQLVEIIKVLGTPSQEEILHTTRPTSMEAMGHEFFNELRSPDCKLPTPNPLPQLFYFTERELADMDERLRGKLMPKHHMMTISSGQTGMQFVDKGVSKNMVQRSNMLICERSPMPHSLVSVQWPPSSLQIYLHQHPCMAE